MSRTTASHAGDWYTADGSTCSSALTRLTGWLAQVDDPGYPIQGCKAIIAPHAGYAYSGPAAAWAYKSIDTTGIKRVFVLGPSHHLYINGCALSKCKSYATPLGDLPLDLENLSISADEDEHSLEMHLPYIRKVFEGKDIQIVPIMVGAIDQRAEAAFGAILAPYLAREDTFCVVSSDFCHWGTRFSYTYYYPAPSAPALDHAAMALLAKVPPAADAHAHFAEYLAETKNTICGRHPIGVLLGAMAALAPASARTPELKWVRYEQSSACLTIRDSSVSYASAWVRF
ncbi:MEMO1 family [Mycena alexandri]|uniref:MEMO1 family n=1 Tax=Mycena alexandri TaxID=1745969 RepID=A0AAD6T1T7_9AGAR|nr:MEMO1 family [Mycena alexandri]